MVPKEPLSEREIEILELVATGASNKEVAARLDISSNTVKVHMRNIFAKLEVRSRTEAIMAAMETGLLAPVGAMDESRITIFTVSPMSKEPVLWWQKALLFLALLAAITTMAWPQTRPVQARPLLSDPLRDTVSFDQQASTREIVGRWQELAQMPLPCSRLAVVTIGGELITIGGDFDGGVADSVEIYDVRSNTWRLGASKPTPVSNVAAVAIDGKVYVPGGCLADGSATQVMEVYDPGTNSWDEAPALPAPVCAHALATDGERIYVLGGWNGSEYVDDSYIFDVKREEWQTGEALSFPRGHAACVYVRGSLVLIGGYDGRRATDRVEILRVTGGEEDSQGWTQAPPMREARAGLGAVAIGDTIYVVGGGWSAAIAFNESLSLATGMWETWEAPVNGNYRNMGVTSDESTVYAVGGWMDGIMPNLFRYQAVYRLNLPLTQGGVRP